MSDLFVIIALVFCILSLLTNSYLHTSLTSKKDEGSLFYRIDSAVNNVKSYVNMLLPHARTATKPIVDEIVLDIDLMQNNSKKVFSEALAKRMSGDILAKQGKMLIDHMEKIYDSMLRIKKAQAAIAKLDPLNKLEEAKSKLKEVCDKLKGHMLSTECESIRVEIGTSNLLNVDFEKADLSTAGSLIDLLVKYRKSPEAMKKAMGEALAKKAAFERKMYLRSKELLKVEQTVRNMTSSQWDDLEIKLEGANDMLENVTRLINDDVHAKVSKYESIRHVLYLLIILFIIIVSLVCSVVFIHNFCFPGDLTRRVRNSTKVTLYISMMVMPITVIVCMATFLIGGYSQTEVCRYLEERPLRQDNASQLHLDRIVNGWLDENWSVIEEKASNFSSMPLPRPRDIFRGLLTSCKANKSILVAINGIDTMDLSAVSKPEMTARFLRLGRQIIHEGLNESNPDDFLRPTMKTDMEQLLTLGKNFFTKSNYSAYVRELNKTLLSRDVSNVESRMQALSVHLQKATNKDTRDISEAVTIAKYVWTTWLKKVKNLSFERDQLIKGFTALEKYSNLTTIVFPMFPAIETLKKFIHNKTHWISVADELFDEIIVKLSYENSPKLMAKSTREIMSVLGPCRHLYNAFIDVGIGTCSSVVKNINLMWLFFGVAILFLTPSMVIALLLLTKAIGIRDGATINEKGDMRGDDESGIRLQEIPNSQQA